MTRDEATALAESGLAAGQSPAVVRRLLAAHADAALVDEVVAACAQKAPEVTVGLQLPSSPPGLLRKAANLASAVTRHVAHGCPTVPDEEKDRRLAVCAACPEYTAKGTCNKCGCTMKTKASWALEVCPLDKWGKWVPEESAPAPRDE